MLIIFTVYTYIYIVTCFGFHKKHHQHCKILEWRLSCTTHVKMYIFSLSWDLSYEYIEQCVLYGPKPDKSKKVKYIEKHENHFPVPKMWRVFRHIYYWTYLSKTILPTTTEVLDNDFNIFKCFNFTLFSDFGCYSTDSTVKLTHQLRDKEAFYVCYT